LNYKIIKPSLSRFTKLKTPNILFPEFLLGDKQDNRIRERAFRDVLKDLTPLCMGFNRTIRIPYHVTSKKINEFTNLNLKDILNFLKSEGLLSEFDLSSKTI
jgi:hypothetical protein